MNVIIGIRREAEVERDRSEGMWMNIVRERNEDTNPFKSEAVACWQPR